jgi:PAS domain S-box-containing protein
MVVVYWLLVVFWFGVLISIATFLTFDRPPILPKQYNQVRTASLVVASVLFIDSLYWAITNSSRVGIIIDKSVEAVLRTPSLVAAVKLLVLFSALSFFIIILRASQVLTKEFDEITFTSVIEQTWDAVGILDENGKVKYWNTGAEQLFGWKRERVIGQHIKNFLVPEDLHPEIDKHLEEIKTTGKAAQNYHSYRKTSWGQRIPIELTISPIHDSTSRFKGYFGIMRADTPRPTSHGFVHFSDTGLRQRSEKYVFVCMTYHEDVVPPNVWSFGIKDAVKANKLEAVRASEDLRPGRIVDQVFYDIQHAELVIVDLTGGPPNVFYELGIAHVLNKATILLVNQQSSIPFDVLAFRAITYDVNNLEHLRNELSRAIQKALNEKGDHLQ